MSEQDITSSEDLHHRDGGSDPGARDDGLGVVVSGAFINFLLHNHSIKKKSFSGDVNYEANFAFFFNFIRELNIYSPLVSISQIIN
jgi:hypothetical protein